MSEEARELTPREIAQRDGFALTATGLKIVKPDLTETEWIDILRAIGRRNNGYLWALGDWLVEGARDDRKWTGEATYRKASDITGYSETHLRGCYRVSKAYPASERKFATTWAIYREVLRVHPELRETILELATQNGWNHSDVALHIDSLPDTALAAPNYQDRNGKKQSKKKSTRGVVKLAEVQCPKCQHVFPIKGHKVRRRANADETH